MNYAEMKRVFMRGGHVTFNGGIEVHDLRTMLQQYPAGKRRHLRADLKSATATVPRKHARGNAA